MKILIISLAMLLYASLSFAQKDVKITYEKRQKIDLEDLSIQGDLITPGDFGIESEKGQKDTMEIFRRKNYHDRLRMNIEYIY